MLSAKAGTPLAEIEALVASKGQQLAFEPLDYGPLLWDRKGAGTLGGALAANLSGPRRIKAGAARDHFLGVSAVSGRGETFKSGGRVVKNVTGYDLCKVLAGSFGTLAVMTDVTIKTLPRPETEETVLIFGLDDAEASRPWRRPWVRMRVSGAAHLPGAIAALSGVVAGGRSVTAFRLEGVAPSVAHRKQALASVAETLWRAGSARGGDLPLLLGGRARRRAAGGRRASGLADFDRADQGADVVAAISAKAEAQAFYDWGGGWSGSRCRPPAMRGRRSSAARCRGRRARHADSRTRGGAGRGRCVPSPGSGARGIDQAGQGEFRSQGRAQSGTDVGRGVEPHADNLHPRPTRRSAGRGKRENSARLRALRLLPGDLPDLCAARRRTRQPARAHLPHQGHAGDMSGRPRPRWSSTSTAASPACPA